MPFPILSFTGSADTAFLSDTLSVKMMWTFLEAFSLNSARTIASYITFSVSSSACCLLSSCGCVSLGCSVCTGVFPQAVQNDTFVCAYINDIFNGIVFLSDEICIPFCFQLLPACNRVSTEVPPSVYRRAQRI